MARNSLIAWWRRMSGAGEAPHDRTGATASPSPAGAAANEARYHLAQPEANRFDERGMVARGGMARIDRVFDKRMGRDSAMKRIEDTSDNKRMKMLDEAQITAQLEHPNVVPIHDIFADREGLPGAIMMKLIEGRTLHALIHDRPEGRYPDHREFESLLRVFVKVCDAVDFAHDRGVIHRDIKPENVMVGSFGQVYLMDWGLAKVTGMPGAAATERVSEVRTTHNRQERRGEVYGTPAYMALEQAFGDVESMDARTDVYGLGGLLYEILTRQPPHMDTTSVIKGTPPHPQEVAGNRPLPAGLCAIAMKALAAAQEDRYQTVDALREDVEAFIRAGGWFPQKRFAAGETIIREGEAGRTAYIIESGTCEVSRTVGTGRERVLELGPGEPFGEAALFADTPRTATVAALTDVVVTVIDRDSLDQEFERHGWLRSLVSAMGTRFVEIDRELKSRRRSGGG